MTTSLDVGLRLSQRGLLHNADTLDRIAITMSRLPKSWQGIQTRADIFAALEAAYVARDRDEQIRTWERIRYLAAFPEVPGMQKPLYSAMRGSASIDPHAGGQPPTFDMLMAALNRAGGWEA